nr:hypothetical protein [Tanacetum cinerariifolium]
IKHRLERFKPIPDDDRPATLKPAWVIPTSYILDVANNWANALASTYQALEENSLLAKTGDMRMFMHWYDYLKEITLRRADYQEYTIAKKDFKSLYPSDFEDLNLLLLEFHLNHLSGLDKHMLSTAKQLNLTKPGWDAKGFEFKHIYTIIKSPRAVVFPVCNNEQKIMRFNEIYKFSGMLTNIMEALDLELRSTRLIGSIRNALLVDGYAILTTDFFREQNDLLVLFIRLIEEFLRG